MKSGILSFNKGLFLQHSRSILWISVFFLLAQILLLPLRILVVLRDEWGLKALLEQNSDNVLFSISYSVQFLSYLVFPVLAGIILTSYMTKKSSSDFMHSLPFKRASLLTHVYLAGAAALIVPIAVNAVILLTMRPFVEPVTYTIGNLAEWAAVSVFIVLFMFLVTVLVGMVVGPAILQGIMAYGILVLPAGLVLLTLENARYFINGLAIDAYTSKLVESGIFLFRAGNYEARPFSGTEWLVYTAIALIITAVSFYLYKVRPAEAVDETIVFPFFRWAFIFVFTFVAMLIGGMYFAEFLGGRGGWMVAGSVIGSLAGYTLLQMMVQKSLRLIWPWKGFVFYTAMIFVGLIPGMMFANSYETALPEAGEVEKVYIGDSPEPFLHMFYMEEQQKLKKPDAGFLKGTDSIQEVIDVHTALIKLDRSGRAEAPVTITYSMKDGSRIQRQYTPPAKEITEITKNLRKNAEFIRESNPFFALNSREDILYFSFHDSITGSQVNIADEKAVQAVQQAVEKDAMSGEARMFSGSYSMDIGYIDFLIENKEGLSISSPVRLSDEHTIQAIQKYAPNGKTFASADNVEKAFIVMAKNKEEKQMLRDFMEQSVPKEPDWSKLPLDYKQVKSREEIEKLLDPAKLTEDGNKLILLVWKSNAEYINFSIAGLKE